MCQEQYDYNLESYKIAYDLPQQNSFKNSFLSNKKIQKGTPGSPT